MPSFFSLAMSKPALGSSTMNRLIDSGECRAGARGHQQKVGEGRVGDVQLAAVQAPAALDALGAGLHGAHVGAAVRLAQAEPGHFPAGQRGGQEARFLGRRAGFPDRPDAEVGVGRPGRGECLRQITEFFAHNAVADLVQAAAAVGLGVAHAQQAQLAPALEYAPGKGLLFFGLEHQGASSSWQSRRTVSRTASCSLEKAKLKLTDLLLWDAPRRMGLARRTGPGRTVRVVILYREFSSQ